MNNDLGFLDKKLDYASTDELKKILKDKARHILEKISLLNQEYNTTNYRHEKASIGKEIDFLEVQLKKIDDVLIYELGDDDVALSMIDNQKKEINELEFLIQNNHLPKSSYIRLFNKKLSFNTVLNELTFKKLYSKNGIDIPTYPKTPIINEPYQSENNSNEKGVEFVEIERLVPIPTIEERIVYKDSQPNEVEKIVEVEVPIACDVEKIVEVNELVDVPYYQPAEPVYYDNYDNQEYFEEEPMYYDDQNYYNQDYSMYDNYDEYYEDNFQPIVDVENRDIVYNLHDENVEPFDNSSNNNPNAYNPNYDYFDDDDEFYDDSFE